MVIDAPTIEYERLIHKELCPDKTLIKSEEQCKLAAVGLNIPWGGSFRSSANNTLPGCFTQGLRQRMMVKEYIDVLTGSFKVLFNSNLKVTTDISKINIDYRAICGNIEGINIEF